MIRAGSAVRISWPSSLIPEFRDRLDGKKGVVFEVSGRVFTEAAGEQQLYRVQVEGLDRVQHLGESHLALLRPDLERYIHSTRFALTGDDVVNVDYPGDISTCQSCGRYADAIVHKSCPACGGYLG